MSSSKIDEPLVKEAESLPPEKKEDSLLKEEEDSSPKKDSQPESETELSPTPSPSIILPSPDSIQAEVPHGLTIDTLAVFLSGKIDHLKTELKMEIKKETTLLKTELKAEFTRDLRALKTELQKEFKKDLGKLETKLEKETKSLKEIFEILNDRIGDSYEMNLALYLPTLLGINNNQPGQVRAALFSKLNPKHSDGFNKVAEHFTNAAYLLV